MSRRQKYKKLKIKKGSTIISLILFVLMSAIIFSLMVAFVFAFVSYTLDSKLSVEIAKFQKAAEAYEEGDRKTFSELITDYFVLDENGNTIDSAGENTCVYDKSVDYELYTSNSFSKLYLDRDNTVYTIDDDEIRIKGFKLLAQLDLYSDADEEGDQEEVSPDEVLKSVNQSIELPVWSSLKLKNSSNELFVKLNLSYDMNAVIMLVIMIAGIVAIGLVMFILILISALRNRRIQKNLLKMFYSDVTTSGNNRVKYFSQGSEMLKKGKNKKKQYVFVNIVMINFLNYCISHSIKEGEKLLCRLYRILNENLRKDELLAHFGSGDFALLLVEPDHKHAIARLETLLPMIEEMETGHKYKYHIGGFLPLNLPNEKGKYRTNKKIDAEEAYNNARTARETLLGTDSSGIAMFDEKMLDERKWEETVNDRQQEALNNEEFIIYYQPKYDPRTNKLAGAEALIRWQSPDFGFVTPYRFIPIFEKNGFIVNIDHYMLKHVAADQKRWLDAGYKCVPVSVNVSRAHFIEADLAEQIRDIVDKAGAPHNLIEIELTESAFFDDKNAIVNTINRLKKYGFEVSMDDFGSGYSSLNSLKDMPLDVLKLDAEFFRGENESERGRIVVSEAIRLAKSLNMRTVAEGVEAKEQVDFLAEQDCDMIQGYYFAKPMPGKEFEERMRDDDKKKKEKEAEMVLYEKLNESSGGGKGREADDEGTHITKNYNRYFEENKNDRDDNGSDHSGGIGIEAVENVTTTGSDGTEGDHSGGIGIETQEKASATGSEGTDGDHSGGVGIETADAPKNVRPAVTNRTSVKAAKTESAPAAKAPGPRR